MSARDRVSLIVTGGTHRPGDFLKAIAPGADIVYLGQNALFAMVYHQIYTRVLGKPALKDVNTEDMRALSELASKVTGVKTAC